MELNKLAPYRACEILKEVLSQTYQDKDGNEYSFFNEFGVVDADSIFVGNVPLIELPEVYVIIVPNGSTQDIGMLANQTMLLQINTALKKGVPNLKRNSAILNQLNNILTEPIEKDGCWFSLNMWGAVAENINLTNGYSTTMININTKIL